MGIYYGDPNTPIDLGKVQRQNEANINDIQRGRQNPAASDVKSNFVPLGAGTAHPGTSNEVSRQDHIHPGYGGGGDGAFTVYIAAITVVDVGWTPWYYGAPPGTAPGPLGHVLTYGDSTTPPICTIHDGEGGLPGVQIHAPIPFPGFSNPYGYMRSYLTTISGMYINGMSSSGLLKESSFNQRSSGIFPPSNGHWSGFNMTNLGALDPGDSYLFDLYLADGALFDLG